MSTYLETARQALKLHRKGHTAVEIKQALKLGYAHEANRAVNVALAEETYLEAALSQDELTLLINIGRAQLRQLERGDTCRPKLKYCSGMFWARGKAERIARKRLDTERKGEDCISGTGLGLLCSYHGGYVFLTRAGWALFHTFEQVRRGGAA